jgi:hypothetical protein
MNLPNTTASDTTNGLIRLIIQRCSSLAGWLNEVLKILVHIAREYFSIYFVMFGWSHQPRNVE